MAVSLGDSMGDRFERLSGWVSQQIEAVRDIRMVSGDASFRRYYRVHHPGPCLIAVDACPQKEPMDSFFQVQRLLQGLGVRVPQQIASDFAQGFFLLEDFGDTLCWDALDVTGEDAAHCMPIYQQAISLLVQLQQASPDALQALPPYDVALLTREMALFGDWFMGDLLQLSLSARERAQYQDVVQVLIDSAVAQPQVCVHRDYHSKNLMLLGDGQGLGTIDFQDAVHGPISYDLVSLLRDCYYAMPAAWVAQLTAEYLDTYQQLSGVRLDPEAFKGWFDLMGVQRHLKAVGIFARLCLRDSKPDYILSIPRTLRYIYDQSQAYAVLTPLQQLLESKVLPAVYQRIGGSEAWFKEPLLLGKSQRDLSFQHAVGVV